jgi:leucyl/phenylalanyl-tRNA--protein transferase
MFFLERDASKVALSALVDRLNSQQYHFIDAQQKTEHLQRLGAQPIKRKDYLIMLKQALEHETKAGKW